ncbi:MAG: hypothetical protein IT437_00475 [Phycisphaerales bacterium]|nr:hypothetical protein [Phycisphaerales bacterium]
MRKTLLGTALLGLVCLLPACRSGYDVSIRNMTDHPILARIQGAHPDGAGQTLANDRLGPGDRTSLFTQQDYLRRVWLEIEYDGSAGHPASMDLVRGRTVVNIQGSGGGHGTPRIEEVSRP